MARPVSVTLGVGGDFTAFNAGLQRAVLNAQKTLNAARFSSPLGVISKDTRDFERSLQAASQRVIAFSAALGTLAAAGAIIKSIVKDTIQVEQAFTDINSVFQLSSANLQKFSKDLFDVARQTSSSFEVAADAAKEFSRQGLDSAQTLKRVRDSLILTRATGLDVTKSVETLTATINSFNSASVDSTRIINKLVAVDQNFAVSARDLAEAISRVGSTAQDAGVNFDQLIGLITAAQQTTARGGSVIGNSLKTIFTRVGRSDTLQQLEDLNIEVRDLNGNALPALQIMTNLAKGFDKLGESAKQQAAELVGGVFQINVLRSVLKDLGKEQGIAAQATKTSTSAFDEAIKRNEALNKSLQSLLTQTELTGKQIGAVIGKITFSDKLKGVIGLTNENPFVEAFKNINTSDIGLHYGEDVGANIAEGILSGIGNVLTGPAIVYLSKILGGIVTSTFKTFGGDLMQLAGINSETKKQLSLAETVKSIYEQQGLLLQKQLGLLTSINSSFSGIAAKGGVGNASRMAMMASGGSFGGVDTTGSRRSVVTSPYERKEFFKVSDLYPSAGMPGFSGTTIGKSATDKTNRLNALFTLMSRESSGETAGRYTDQITDLASYIPKTASPKIYKQLATTYNQVTAPEDYVKSRTKMGMADSIIKAQEQGRQESYRKNATAIAQQEERLQILRAALQEDAVNGFTTKIQSPLGGLFAKGRAEDFISSRGNLGAESQKRIRESAAYRNRQFKRNAAFGASFLLPSAAGFIPEGQGGTASGEGLAATSGALQGAGIGLAIAPGPWGAITGALIGAGLGFVSKMRQSFEELAKQIEDSNAKSVDLINKASEFSRLGESIRGTVASGGNDRDIRLLSGQQRDVFSSISDNALRRKLLAAQGNADLEEKVRSELIEKTSRQTAARDVASSIKSLDDSRGPVSKFFGGTPTNKSFSDLSSALQVALQRGINANGESFKGKASSAFKNSTQEGLKLLGVTPEEFPQLFDKLDNSVKDIQEAFDYAANSIEQFSDVTEKGRIKQADFTRQITQMVQGLRFASQFQEKAALNAAEISKAIAEANIGVSGGSADLLSLQRGNVQIGNIQQTGAAQLEGGIGKARGDILDSIITNKAGTPELFTAALKAQTEEEIAALEKIATNQDVKKAVREAVLELKGIKLNTKLEIDKTSALIQINRIQTQLQERSNILEHGRYSEETIQKLFDARLTGRSGLGKNPTQLRANAVLEQSDILNSLGVGQTNNTQRIRDTLSIISATGTLAEIVSTITHSNVGSNVDDIRAAAKAGISNLSGQSDISSAADIDVLHRILSALDRLGINPDNALPKSANASSGDTGFNSSVISTSRDLLIKISNSQDTLAEMLADQNRRRSSIQASQRGELISESYLKAPQNALTEERDIRESISKRHGVPNTFEADLQTFSDNFLSRLLPDTQTHDEYGRRNAIKNPARSAVNTAFSKAVKSGDFSEMLDSATNSNGEIFNLIRNNSKLDPKQFADTLRAMMVVAANTLAKELLAKEYKNIEDEISGPKSAGTVRQLSQPSLRINSSKIGAFKFGNGTPDFSNAGFVTPTGLANFNPNEVSSEKNVFSLNGQTSPKFLRSTNTFRLPTTGLEAPDHPITVALDKDKKLRTDTEKQLADAQAIGDTQKVLDLTEKLQAVDRDIVRLKSYGLGLSEKEINITDSIVASEERLQHLYNSRKKGILVTGSQIESQQLDLADKQGLSGDYINSAKNGFQAHFSGLQVEAKNFKDTMADVALSLDKNFSQAFGDFAVGAQKGKEAFRSFVTNVLQDASRAFASKAIQGLLGMLLGPGGGLGSAMGLPQTQATGGIMTKAPALLTSNELVVPKEKASTIGYDVLNMFNRGQAATVPGYAYGGLVKGGSGVKDDVFAMLRPGDYVLNKNAVRKYGSEKLLDMVQHGRVHKRFIGGLLPWIFGGAAIGGGIGYLTGGKKGAIIGAIAGGFGGGLFGNALGKAAGAAGAGPIAGDFASKAASNSSGVWKSLALAGVLGGAAGLLSPKASNDSNTLPSLTLAGAEASRQQSEALDTQNLSKNGDGYLVPVQTKDGFTVYERARVPATHRFASGGMVPSMLTGSEAVIPREIVNSMGAKAFSNGGFVGSPSMNMNPSSDNSGSAPVRDININVTVNKDGSTSETSTGMDDKQNGTALARQIRSAVIDVVSNEMRAGGTLYSAYGTSRVAR